MIPVVTPDEMARIDAAAPEPVEELISRAGAAVAREALAMLGGGYGRRVVVLVGPGNNGADGRDAAERLRRRGALVEIHGLDALPDRIEEADLIIDAVLGTGARPGFAAPEVRPGIPVLAVDLPSGVDGLTGSAGEAVLIADRTVTFAAVKPGLLLEPGRSLAGVVSVADIGLDTSSATAWLLTPEAVVRRLPGRPRTAHKWNSAVWIVAGSPGMTGAAHLAARGAQRAGAGYVRLSSPGLPEDQGRPDEVVGTELPATNWAGVVLEDLDRFRSLVVGPGLGRGAGTRESIVEVVRNARVPVLVDGDGLSAFDEGTLDSLADRTSPTVLTPHDGEFRQLTGSPPESDRFAAARRLAAAARSVVLLKGPTTIVAHPDGRVLVCAEGDSRLATAGTGDVLSGVIAGLIGAGADPFHAAGIGAYLHAAAGAVGSGHGLVAGDLVDRLPTVFDQLLQE